MTNNNMWEISLDTGYLPCGFAHISRHAITHFLRCWP